MKKQTTIIDPNTGTKKVLIVSDTPITSVDLVTQAAKTYVSDIKKITPYPETSILSRSTALMLTSIRLPTKSITTIRD